MLCSLGVEPIDSGIVNSPPRPPKKQVVDRYMLARVCFSAAVIISGTLWVYKNEVSKQVCASNLFEVPAEYVRAFHSIVFFYLMNPGF